MGFSDSNILDSKLVFIIPNAALYHFGILTSQYTYGKAKIEQTAQAILDAAHFIPAAALPTSTMN